MANQMKNAANQIKNIAGQMKNIANQMADLRAEEREMAGQMRIMANQMADLRAKERARKAEKKAIAKHNNRDPRYWILWAQVLLHVARKRGDVHPPSMSYHMHDVDPKTYLTDTDELTVEGIALAEKTHADMVRIGGYFNTIQSSTGERIKIKNPGWHEVSETFCDMAGGVQDML